MLKSLLLVLAISFGLCQTASAYFVAVPASQGAIQYDQPVRILVPGRGTDLGSQPLWSALARAQLYKRNFSNDQVVLVSVFENAKTENSLLQNGWVFLEKNDLKFETDVASAEILKFQRIRSLDFFGHNSPSLGTQTDGLGFRFDFRKPVVASISSRFEKGAFAMLHGCNSGWILAQGLSKIWGIAVAGSFTGTRFERLHNDGHFYVADDTKAPSKNWASVNPDLGGISCSAGGCFRMRPAFSAYVGKWGDFSGPLLSHYKFFCQLETKECEMAMASSLYGFLAEKSLKPASSFAEFKKVAQEYLCPVYKDRKITTNCLQQLQAIEQGQGNMTLSFVVNDAQLACTMRSCSGVMTCDDHTCKVQNRISKNSSTLAQEYLHLLNGYKALSQEGF